MLHPRPSHRCRSRPIDPRRRRPWNGPAHTPGGDFARRLSGPASSAMGRGIAPGRSPSRPSPDRQPVNLGRHSVTPGSTRVDRRPTLLETGDDPGRVDAHHSGSARIPSEYSRRSDWRAGQVDKALRGLDHDLHSIHDDRRALDPDGPRNRVEPVRSKRESGNSFALSVDVRRFCIKGGDGWISDFPAKLRLRNGRRIHTRSHGVNRSGSR